MHSPIDINFPYEFNNFNLQFQFNTIHYTNLKKIKKYTFVIDEYYGLIDYENLSFKMNKIYIKFPAQHKIANLGFSMEM